VNVKRETRDNLFLLLTGALVLFAVIDFLRMGRALGQPQSVVDALSAPALGPT